MKIVAGRWYVVLRLWRLSIALRPRLHSTFGNGLSAFVILGPLEISWSHRVTLRRA